MLASLADTLGGLVAVLGLAGFLGMAVAGLLTKFGKTSSDTWRGEASAFQEKAHRLEVELAKTNTELATTKGQLQAAQNDIDRLKELLSGKADVHDLTALVTQRFDALDGAVAAVAR